LDQKKERKIEILDSSDANLGRIKIKKDKTIEEEVILQDADSEDIKGLDYIRDSKREIKKGIDTESEEDDDF
jgi:hypothetical protein